MHRSIDGLVVCIWLYMYAELENPFLFFSLVFCFEKSNAKIEFDFLILFIDFQKGDLNFETCKLY